MELIDRVCFLQCCSWCLSLYITVAFFLLCPVIGSIYLLKYSAILSSKITLSSFCESVSISYVTISLKSYPSSAYSFDISILTLNIYQFKSSFPFSHHLYFLTPRIFVRVSYTFRLVVSNLVYRYSNIFEYFVECFCVMTECYCAVMWEVLLN